MAVRTESYTTTGLKDDFAYTSPNTTLCITGDHAGLNMAVQVSPDGTNWLFATAGGVFLNDAGAVVINGFLRLDGVFHKIRVNINSITSGTVTIHLLSSR